MLITNGAQRSGPARREKTMNANEAWDTYVGNQSATEFWGIAQAQGAQDTDAAVASYLDGHPFVVGMTTDEIEAVARLLVRHLDAQLD
jgi:hypothetical protein